MPQSKPCYRFWNLVVLMALLNINSMTVYAEEPLPEKILPFWNLIIKPRICVKSVEQSVCEMQTYISWTAQVAVDTCLFSSEKNDVLKCWTHSSQGGLMTKVVSDKQVRYWLSRLGEDEILVKAIVRIVTVPKKGVRQRRRHIWSLL